MINFFFLIAGLAKRKETGRLNQVMRRYLVEEKKKKNRKDIEIKRDRV